MIRTLLAGVVAMAAVGASSAAYAVDYKCTMQEKPGIPPIIFVLEDNGKTYAFDGLIKEIYDKPIPAKISVDNDRRTTYSWVVKGVIGKNSDGGNSVNGKFSFRLTRQKSSGAATIQAKIVGYDNSFRSKGSCAVVK